jgi:hypothetical protein
MVACSYMLAHPVGQKFVETERPSVDHSNELVGSTVEYYSGQAGLSQALQLTNGGVTKRHICETNSRQLERSHELGSRI